MKEYLPLIVSRDIQIKTALRYHYTPTRRLAETGRSWTVLHSWWVYMMVHVFGEDVWHLLIKLSDHLLYDPATPVLAIYSRAMKTRTYQKLVHECS